MTTKYIMRIKSGHDPVRKKLKATPHKARLTALCGVAYKNLFYDPPRSYGGIICIRSWF